MNENKQIQEVLPENFASLEEAAAFWDTHSLADYWEQTQEVALDVQAPRRQWIPLASSLWAPVIERARQEGISVETLINLWVAERLQISA
ncbi:MAG: CopG family antitoxin [Caldilineaceae bacterium]